MSDQNPNDFPVFFLASNKFCLSLTVNVECTLRGAGSCVFLPAFEFGFLATCDLPGAPEAFEFGFLATCDEGLFASDVPGCGFLNGSMNLLHSPYSG